MIPTHRFHICWWVVSRQEKDVKTCCREHPQTWLFSASIIRLWLFPIKGNGPGQVPSPWWWKWLTNQRRDDVQINRWNCRIFLFLWISQRQARDFQCVDLSVFLDSVCSQTFKSWFFLVFLWILFSKIKENLSSIMPFHPLRMDVQNFRTILGKFLVLVSMKNPETEFLLQATLFFIPNESLVFLESVPKIGMFQSDFDVRLVC